MSNSILCHFFLQDFNDSLNFPAFPCKWWQSLERNLMIKIYFPTKHHLGCKSVNIFFYFRHCHFPCSSFYECFPKIKIENIIIIIIWMNNTTIIAYDYDDDKLLILINSAIPRRVMQNIILILFLYIFMKNCCAFLHFVTAVI